MHVSEQITNILNYYKENPGCDPNMYEYIVLCHDMVNYLGEAAPNYGVYVSEGNEKPREKYPIPCAVLDKFNLLSEEFKAKLLGNGLEITEDSPLYELYLVSYRNACTYGTYERYPAVELHAKLGAVALFIAQQKRENPDFKYDNLGEWAYIQELATQCPWLLESPPYRTKKEGEEEWTEHSTQPRVAQLLINEISDSMEKGYTR